MSYFLKFKNDNASMYKVHPTQVTTLMPVVASNLLAFLTDTSFYGNNFSM